MAKADDELLAMNRVSRLLAKLPPDAQVRIVTWLVGRYAAEVTHMVLQHTPPGEKCKAPGFSAAT